jgi:hypothetical protein
MLMMLDADDAAGQRGSRSQRAGHAGSRRGGSARAAQPPRLTAPCPCPRSPPRSALKDIDPEETLVVVISKTFTTAETMLNARTVRTWLTTALGEQLGGCGAAGSR